MFRQRELVLGDASKDRKSMVTAKRSVAMHESDAAAEVKAAFVLGLRARGIRDLVLLRALEKVPREIFVPHRYVDLAGRDLSLPIGCGQTLSEPWLVARMIEVLAPSPNHSVLEVGTGSGYATAILAEIAQNVLSIERFQSLAIAARLRLEKLALANAAVVFGDGLAIRQDAGPFDRILIHGCVEDLPARLLDVLSAEGRMVLAKPDPATARRQILVEISRRSDGSLVEQPRGTCRLQMLVPGLARIL
ncbi:MAG: protein-L-isoaspartate O-methyltransferase family protein [Methylovirgula sp.]